MFIVHIGNISQGVILYLATISYCYADRDNKQKNLQFCFQINPLYDIMFLYTILSWVILILSSLNSIRCQMNFGMNVGKYSMYKLYLLSNMTYIFLVSNNHNILTVKYDPEDELYYGRYNRRPTNRDSGLTNRNSARSTSREVQDLQM